MQDFSKKLLDYVQKLDFLKSISAIYFDTHFINDIDW